jgi:hypothetical protein
MARQSADDRIYRRIRSDLTAAREKLFELRRTYFEANGFVIIDDFQGHPLLPELTAAARRITAQVNATTPDLDPTTAYVHRTSPFRGESRDRGWTGYHHVFTKEEAWAVRGALHPAWKSPCFAQFLGSEEVLAFVDGWSNGQLQRDALGMCDATLFVNPSEGDFSEGWHRDARWHGGEGFLQQETERA